MNGNRIVVTGASCLCNFANSPAALVEGLLGGRVAEYSPLFSPWVSEKFGVPVNPFHTRMKKREAQSGGSRGEDSDDALVGDLLEVTAQALVDAGLGIEELRGEGVQVLWGTPGNQPKLEHFLGYVHENNHLDLLFSPRIDTLQVKHFRQDTVAAEYQRLCRLKRPVYSLYTACSSALSAVDMAARMLRAGRARKVIVLAWQKVNLFDIVYLDSLNMLSPGIGKPFCRDTDGVTVGFGIGCLVLETEKSAYARDRCPHFSLGGISSNRSLKGSVNTPSLTVAFRDISHCIECALAEAAIGAEAIDCIFPHGNGIKANDQAEAHALKKFFGRVCPPVINYTYQLSYMLSASAIFDLIVAVDSFRRQRLIPFFSPEVPDNTYELDFFAYTSAAGMPRPKQTEVRNILKLGIGVDGSIGACVLQRVDGFSIDN